MEFNLLSIFTFIGSLGLFLYGMMLMSEALQRLAGDKMRSIMSAMTSTRFTGILTGVLVTALIQSSSATTVMVVSFVNAGLMTLVQSISVIMGANIGTTVTAWIISLFGFKFNISDLAIPLIAFAFPLLFVKKNVYKNWGEFIVGFALLFMGMEMLKNSVPDIKQNPEVLAFLAQYTNLGFLSVLLFLFVGTILTVIVQSSSAMMAITLVMCAQGWISFEIAAAMVLGENIGTTITANVAALSANVSAKRAALSHTIFNLFGVIWLLIVFYPFTSMIKALVVEIGPTDPTQQDAFALSLFHTMFNVCNVLILNWFAKFIAKTVTKLIPQSETDEEFRLAFISTGMLSTAELSIFQAQKEMLTYTERVKRMFGIVKSLNEETNENAALKYFERVQKYELISDRMEMEIAAYLNKVSQGRLSNESKDQIHRMLRIVSEIESVADSCDNLAKILDRKRQGKISFTAEMVANIHNMLNLLDKAFDEMLNILDKINDSFVDATKAESIESNINHYRDELKGRNIIAVNDGVYPYATSVVYMDFIIECEKMGDYIINVVEAVADSKPLPANN